MKKHLFIITALFLSVTSCRSTKEVSHRADTVYVAQRHYDSVIIDRYTTTENKGDTVLVDRLKTEYRYRLSTDTIYRSYTDTVYTTAPLPPEKTPPTNLKYLLVVPCLILFFSFLFRLKIRFLQIIKVSCYRYISLSEFLASYYLDIRKENAHTFDVVVEETV